MDEVRQIELESIVNQLEELVSTLEDLQAEEEEYRDNIPECFHDSQEYERTDMACDNLFEAGSFIYEAIYSIQMAIGE